MNPGVVRFHDSLQPLLIDIEAIRPHPANPRNGDVDAIAESIEVNGFIAPIIAQRSSGHILAGNHRYYALMQLGSGIAPVVWVDCDDVAAKRYLLADNRTSDLGQYDNAILVDLLAQLEADDALRGSGYVLRDLEDLRLLEEMKPDFSDRMSWPTISIQVPPHIKNAFYDLTAHAAGDDRDRFELLLRKAGWES